MASTNLASVYVTVVPSLKGMNRALQQGMKQPTRNISRSFNKSISSGVSGGLSSGMKFGMRSVNRSIGAIGSTMSKAFSSAGNALDSAIIKPLSGATALMSTLTAASFTQGAQFNAAQQLNLVSLKTIMGSREKAMEQIARFGEFAMASPFDRQVLMGAQKQLLAFGFTAKEVLPTLDAIQNTIGAFGGSNQQIKEVASIFAKMKSSAMLNQVDINMLADRGINAPKLLAQARGLQEEKVREALYGDPLRGEEARRALTDIIRQMAKNSEGAAADVKKTFTGSFQRVQAAFRDIGAVMSAKFIDPLGGGAFVTWANLSADSLRQIERIMKELFALNDGGLSKFVSNVDKSLTNVKGFLSALKGTDVQQFGEQIKKLSPVFVPLTAAIAAMSFSSLVKSIPILGQLLPTVSPLLALFAGIVAISPELQSTLVDSFQRIWVALKPILPRIVEGAEWMIDGFTDILVKGLPHIVDFAIKLPEIMRDMIGGIWGSIGPELPKIVGWFTQIGQSIWREIEPALPELGFIVGGLISLLKEFATEALPIIIDIGGNLLNVFAESGAEIWAALQPVLPVLGALAVDLAYALSDLIVIAAPVLTDIIGFLAENHELVLAVVGGLGAAVGLFKLMGFVSGVIGTITGAVTALSGAIAGAGGGMAVLSGVFAAVFSPAVGIVLAVVGAVGAIGFALYQIIGNFDEFKSGFWELMGYFEDGMNNLTGWLGEMGEGFLHGAIRMFEAVGDWIGQFIENIKNNWETFKHIVTLGILGENRGVSGIPQMASGGVVQARAGGTLAVLGEGGRNEAVVDEGLLNKRLRDLEGIRGSGDSRGVVIQGNVSFTLPEGIRDPEEFGRRVMEILETPDLRRSRVAG